MVPIHDTDIAEDRWTQAEWEHYELWEKIEHRHRRKKRIWVLVTSLLFLVLSAVPIVVDRMPKWVSRSYAGRMALAMNELKRVASVNQTAYELEFSNDPLITYSLTPVNDCSSVESQGLKIKPTLEKLKLGWLSHFSSASGVNAADFVVLDSNQGTALGVPFLTNRLCYDPLVGSNLADQVGVGVISVNDLTQKRLDRMTVLLVSGSSAEISFD